MMLTTPKGLIKPELTDPADLRIFIGQNMDLIDELLDNVNGTAFAVIKTAEEWELENPILEEGTFGVAKDTLRIKIGDGVRSWVDLPYFTQGEKGNAPAHQWDGTSLQFENPDGTWGTLVNLKGEKGDKGDQGLQGIQGIQGIQGLKGDKPSHQWDGTSLQFENPDGTWGSLVNLKGDQGDQGDPPAYEWEGTALRFENPDGSWGQFVDLKGEQGEKGDKGEKGDLPRHEWQGTALRFERPDGSWGPQVDLRGEKGDKGDTGPMPEHEWQDTAIRFQKPDGTWPSTWVDLKGDPGVVGKHGNESHTEEFITIQAVDAHAETQAALDKLGHVNHAVLTATLDTDDWTGTEAPFAQIREVSGILATDVPIVDVVLSGDWEVDEARLEAWGYIYRIVTSNNSITAYAREKPNVALPLQLKVVR